MMFFTRRQQHQEIQQQHSEQKDRKLKKENRDKLYTRMQHTYLRYECGDSFGLITSSSSSKAPQSNSIIKCVQPSSGSSSSESSIILTTAGSHCLGYHLRTTSPTIKIGHREKLSGGVGTGRALNSDHIVCIDVASPSTTLSHDYNDDKDDGRMHKVATGWVDGAVRVFDVTSDELCGLGSHQGNIISKKGCGLVQSLLSPDDDDDVENEFIMRDPLVLNGHSGSPVRAISFEKAYQHLITGTPIAASRLASGANDGSVVLWDIVAETGLFRLLGHRGGITDLNFVSMGSPLSLSSTSSVSLDLLVSSSLDGLVKIWDLQGQCCIQTIATHMGEVWAASCVSIPDVNYAKRLGGDNAGGDNVADNDGGEKDKQSLDHRIRLVTGSSDGQTRVWSIEPSKRSTLLSTSLNKTEASVIMTQTDIGKSSFDKQAIVEDDHGAVASTTSATTAVIAEDNLDDVCHYMGTLSAPPNVATSADRIACLHFHPNGKYVGVLHANSKNVDIYLIRSTKEALRKKRRRLKRRKEKSKGEKDDNDKFTNKTKTSQKRGILDDPESDDDQQMEKMTLDNSLAAMERTMDPEKLKASDEFEYFGTVRGTHKIKGFVFVAGKIAGGGVKVVCALATNAMETHVLKKER
jgi:WD40 repeat protein